MIAAWHLARAGVRRRWLRGHEGNGPFNLLIRGQGRTRNAAFDGNVPHQRWTRTRACKSYATRVDIPLLVVIPAAALEPGRRSYGGNCLYGRFLPVTTVYGALTPHSPIPTIQALTVIPSAARDSFTCTRSCLAPASVKPRYSHSTVAASATSLVIPSKAAGRAEEVACLHVPLPFFFAPRAPA